MRRRRSFRRRAARGIEVSIDNEKLVEEFVGKINHWEDYGISYVNYDGTYEINGMDVVEAWLREMEGDYIDSFDVYGSETKFVIDPVMIMEEEPSYESIDEVIEDYDGDQDLVLYYLIDVKNHRIRHNVDPMDFAVEIEDEDY